MFFPVSYFVVEKLSVRAAMVGLREWHWRGRRRRRHGSQKSSEGLPFGCMYAVFHLFEFPLPNSHASESKSVVFPERHPQLHEECEALRSMRIKTYAEDQTTATSSSEFDSPAAKTPSLVARLMGLDFIPDSYATPPSLSSSSISRLRKPTLHLDDGHGSRSLPDTPRVSSSRRSDVDYNHRRLSLQINKENMNPDEEIAIARISAAVGKKKMILRAKDEGAAAEKAKSISPGSYARQIVKQVRDNVSRKVGLDITNSVNRTRGRADHRALENHGKKFASSENQSASPSLSTSSLPPSSKSEVKSKQQLAHATVPPSNGSRRREGIRKVSRSTKSIQSKHEESFVSSTSPAATDKKSKRSCLSPPTSHHPMNVEAVGKGGRRNLSTCDKFHVGAFKSIIIDKLRSSGAVGDVEALEERDYVTRILQHAEANGGFRRLRLSHSLDPSMFHYMERFTGVTSAYRGRLSMRWNRKLLFHLVDEMLSGAFRQMGSPLKVRIMKLPEVINLLCDKVGSFSAVNSSFLEDAGEVADDEKFPPSGVVEEGGDEVVADVGEGIVDALVEESILGLSCTNIRWHI